MSLSLVLAHVGPTPTPAICLPLLVLKDQTSMPVDLKLQIFYRMMTSSLGLDGAGAGEQGIGIFFSIFFLSVSIAST